MGSASGAVVIFETNKFLVHTALPDGHLKVTEQNSCSLSELKDALITEVGSN